MTEKQKAAIREFRIDRNKAQAAIRAGYAEKYAKHHQTQIFTPEVMAVIHEQDKRQEIKADVSEGEIIAKLRQYGGLDDRDKGMVVNSGEAIRALELLGKNKAMWTDKVQSTASPPKPLSDEERRIARAAAAALLKPKIVKDAG